ncbi:DUF6267 family protein [Haliscomenobacter sp.]|uniref:DUF6267 family protein n=1 Tax=Haliscomenobacter sp. TaxID=2717303 RepID=UPI0033652C43
MMYLNEGGNVFKDAQGQPLTQRIKQGDIASTVAWLETVTGLDLSHDRDENGIPVKWLGSTGKKPDSGDLDLAVDANEITKAELKGILDAWATKNKQDPRDWTRLTGEAVHFKTPIQGDPKRGYVQTDFMFMPNLEWGTFWLGGGTGSAYKGVFRNVLMSSIAKALGLKASAKGIISRQTDRVVTMDPDQAAGILLAPQYKRNQLMTVESIYKALAMDPDRDTKLADFREYIAREGVKEPDMGVAESDVNFLARLRDRIVNRGYVALVEAEQSGVGGRAKGIEHLEDLVFRRGTQGIRDALEIVGHATQQPKTVTAKWDGKPAVIFGRKPLNGEFVLTDGSGFEAKGYDGLATSPKMMADIQNKRSGDRTELINLYAELFPVLEAALPPNFRGYVKGDLLYMSTPPVEAGNYVFRPNTVEYKIPVKSALGQRIGSSNIGIAIHSMYADAGDARQPLSGVKFNEVPGLMLERPASPRALETETNAEKQLKQLIKSQGRAIDTLFNPTELRAHKITDLAKLCVDFINTKVGSPLNGATLLPEFGKWLETRVTPQKFRNIVEYLNSPTSNTPALAAAFNAFNLLHDVKMHLLRQADTEHPGQEGWVMATPVGYAKAVNRFDPNAFAAQNRQRNNPQQA